MITEPKKCYECNSEVPQINANLLSAQIDTNDRDFVITRVSTKCVNGHKQEVAVIYD